MRKAGPWSSIVALTGIAVLAAAFALVPAPGTSAAPVRAKPVVDGCDTPLRGAGRPSGKAILRPGGKACERAAAGEPLRVLVFSRTTGFRHPSIDDAVAFFSSLPEREGIAATLTEDPTA